MHPVHPSPPDQSLPKPTYPNEPHQKLMVPHDTPSMLSEFYHNPIVQVVIISMVCFCCPGMFNALSGLGGGGQIDATTADNANVALYSTFATTAFLSGTLVNKLGPRLSLSIGSCGYTLFIASYLSYNINENSGFVIASGALLGICAGLLWTAQGSLMLAYATASTKGRYIALFWIIFNLGAVLGEAVALGRTYHSTIDSRVSNKVYIGFLIITLIGTSLTFTLAPPSSIRRSDGTVVKVDRNPSWKTELRAMWRTLLQDPTILLLFPFFWASNWFYTYQFNDYNLALFNLRTRSLNALLYWLSQIFGAGLFGLVLDYEKFFNRQQRAIVGWIILSVVIFIVWGLGWNVQKGYERDSILNKMDWNDSGYVGKVWLYIFYGITDSMWQTYAYWLMGMLADDPRELAPLVGFYKGFQSAGAAVIYRVDANGASYHAIFISSWSILGLALIFLIPVIIFRVKDKLKMELKKQVDASFKLENLAV